MLVSAGRGLAASAPIHSLVTPPQPTPDAFDVPVLPDNPTEVQAGEVVYYYNCMPCHGDHGQGLTDEFRQLWVEDHQNCWGRGCHAGRLEDQGFPIPRIVPAVSDRPDQLLRFPQPEDLFAYRSPPSLERYLDWGWGPILRSKAQALLLNLQRLWIERAM